MGDARQKIAIVATDMPETVAKRATEIAVLVRGRSAIGFSGERRATPAIRRTERPGARGASMFKARRHFGAPGTLSHACAAPRYRSDDTRAASSGRRPVRAVDGGLCE